MVESQLCFLCQGLEKFSGAQDILDDINAEEDLQEMSDYVADVQEEKDTGSHRRKVRAVSILCQGTSV